MNKQRGILILVLLVVGLAGCAPSEAAVREAIEATAAALPATATSAPTVAAETVTPVATATEEATPTAEPVATATSAPTAVPLGEIDLGLLLIVDGDLPEHLEGDLVQYGKTFRIDRGDLAPADNLLSQEV